MKTQLPVKRGEPKEIAQHQDSFCFQPIEMYCGKFLLRCADLRACAELGLNRYDTSPNTVVITDQQSLRVRRSQAENALLRNATYVFRRHQE
jgi:hypothetical protein